MLYLIEIFLVCADGASSLLGEGVVVGGRM